MTSDLASLSPQILAAFPNLLEGTYRVTSPKDSKYNCVAWTLHETSKWIAPDIRWNRFTIEREYGNWPEVINKDMMLETFISLFEWYGFESCTTIELGNDLETIALYSIHGAFAHAARQLPNGFWTSKLGQDQDIEHINLKTLEDGAYGKVQHFMRRSVVQSS